MTNQYQSWQNKKITVSFKDNKDNQERTITVSLPQDLVDEHESLRQKYEDTLVYYVDVTALADAYRIVAKAEMFREIDKLQQANRSIINENKALKKEIVHFQMEKMKDFDTSNLNMTPKI